jgi:F420-non-reducing hydrogenase iron-sulfur subunit
VKEEIMSQFTPEIKVFCCHYTSQQTCVAGPERLQAEGFPGNVAIDRLVCTGKLQVSNLLKAFEAGADGVYVVGCPGEGCHNLMGSQRAAKRVGAVKKALAELAIEPERLEMFQLERGFHPEFIAVAREMNERIKSLGPSPLKGEAQ